MNEAIGKIRAALKGHDLLGAEAIELKPGAVVLVVLRYAAKVSPDEVHSIRQNWATMAEALQAEGVRAVACCVPHGFGLDVVEVAEAAPSAADLLIGVYPNGPGGEPWNATAAAVDAMAAAPLPPDEPFPWDAPAEGYGLDVSPLFGRIGSVPAGVECIPHDENAPDLVITVGPDGVKVKP